MIAADQGRLNRRGQHERAGVVMPLKCVQKHRRKVEITLHKFRLLLRAVHSGEVKHKVTVGAKLVKFRFGIIYVIFVDFVDFQFRACPVLPVAKTFRFEPVTRIFILKVTSMSYNLSSHQLIFSFTIFAGTPAITVPPLSIGFVTTAPVPTTQFSGILTPFVIKARYPTQT